MAGLHGDCYVHVYHVDRVNTAWTSLSRPSSSNRQEIWGLTNSLGCVSLPPPCITTISTLVYQLLITWVTGYDVIAAILKPYSTIRACNPLMHRNNVMKPSAHAQLHFRFLLRRRTSDWQAVSSISYSTLLFLSHVSTAMLTRYWYSNYICPSVRPSVCLSVCLSRSGIVSKPLHMSSYSLQPMLAQSFGFPWRWIALPNSGGVTTTGQLNTHTVYNLRDFRAVYGYVISYTWWRP